MTSFVGEQLVRFRPVKFKYEHGVLTGKQRDVLQFLCAKGLQPACVYERMSGMYGENCLSKKSMKKWHQRFREGHISLTDDPRPGQSALLHHGSFKANLLSGKVLITFSFRDHYLPNSTLRVQQSILQCTARLCHLKSAIKQE